MHRFEWPKALARIDWRAWLMVAWVSWFGMHYTLMVLEQRGQKIRDCLKAPEIHLPSTFENSMMDGSRTRTTSP